MQSSLGRVASGPTTTLSSRLGGVQPWPNRGTPPHRPRRLVTGSLPGDAECSRTRRHRALLHDTTPVCARSSPDGRELLTGI